MQITPKFQEEFSAKIPALTLLANLGWQFINPESVVNLRQNKTGELVLREILRGELKKRRFEFSGKEYPLSDKSIDNIIQEISSPALNEGLTLANERIYNHLLYGISVSEDVNGKKVTPTIQLIDWKDFKNNSFVFTEEFSVLRTNGVDNRRPDIVCFVNGLPLVVLEAKRPDGNAGKGPTVSAGISQHLRNQRQDEIPTLFAYAQLLVSINGSDAKYGTQGTPEKFWAVWKEEDFIDAYFAEIKNKSLNNDQKQSIFSYKGSSILNWYDQLVSGGELAVTNQDRLLISLLSPERLIEFIRYFVLFDKKSGKVVARHQQVFGIKRLIERVNKKDVKGARQGGVIWHTTGSGKSFTMVFLSKALILHESLKNCRLIIVTDRVDLETQLSRTFSNSGELSSKKDKSSAMATSGKRLAEQISKGNERIVFSIVNKFGTATKLDECYNDSPDLIVLVDEGHRTQGGETHVRMKLAMPKAAFVAFTGTPLLKDDKTTNKFGAIVHAYTMQRAVDDGAVTPLLYEERVPELDVNSEAIDAWFNRITDGLTDKQKSDLKRKFASKGQIYSADDRIKLIAYDISTHFYKHIDDGLKGQLACESKSAAIKYKQYLDESGLIESAVVMSAPDTREGNTSVDDSSTPEVTKWWKENVANQDEGIYTKSIIERFENDDNLKLIIVVDKLLTGFDEPKNAVLYIDKPLKEHNLIQAIARVNRLHPLKKFGLLIDYRGILGELDTTIAKYQKLANRTQGGFDIDDLIGLYSQMSTEYKKLPSLYDALWDTFKSVKNKADIEQLRQVLVPKIEEIEGKLVDVNIKVRDTFYDRLTSFSSCLKVALQSASFFEDKSFTEDTRKHYKETLKQLSSLRQIAQQDAGERVDYDAYSLQIKKLMDRHVVGIEVRQPTGVYEVGKMGSSQKPENWSDEKTRNETDIIKTRIAKKIEQDLRDDPYAQEVFSSLLKKAIEEAEALFNHPLKQYLLFRSFEEKVDARELDEIPNKLNGSKYAQAYFGVFKKYLPETFASVNDESLSSWIDLAFNIEVLVNTAVAEYSINPQNIETEIRKNLLPILFRECKKVGAGMDQAKAIVDLVVQITLVGLNKA